MSDRHVTGRTVHITPVGRYQTSIVMDATNEPQHDLHGFCWCQPLVEEVLPEGRIYIHRRSLDSPHIEVTP